MLLTTSEAVLVLVLPAEVLAYPRIERQHLYYYTDVTDLSPRVLLIAITKPREDFSGSLLSSKTLSNALENTALPGTTPEMLILEHNFVIFFGIWGDSEFDVLSSELGLGWLAQT